MNSTRPLKVCCSITHKTVSQRSFKSSMLQSGASMDPTYLSRTFHRLLVKVPSTPMAGPKASQQALSAVNNGKCAQWLVCSSLHSKLQFSVCSNTFLSEPALTFPAICVTIALLSACTAQPHLCSPQASMSLGNQLPHFQFIHHSFLDHFWSLLQTRNIQQDLQVCLYSNPVV